MSGIRNTWVARAMTTRILPLALTLAATAPARAQNPAVTTLTESPDCNCRIELTRVFSLSDSLHPGLFAYSPLVMRDSRGVWYATSNTDGLKQVGVFDQEGRLIKVIGRLGEGPGEFTRVNHIVVGAGDTLYVYDHSQLRRSVFDPDHEFVRTERIPAFMRDMVPLPSGHMIVNSTIRTAEGVDWPLHLVGADGGVLQTFGNETASRRPDDSFLELRSIAVDGGGVLWVAPRNAYELSIYSMAGTRPQPTNRRYRRQVDWFQPWTELSRGAEPPKPNVQQIAFGPDDPTLLWVLISVADAEWAPVPPQRSSKELIDSLYDDILEVIDIESGSVLASRRFGPVLSRLTFQGLIPALRIDEANKVWMDVFMPTLHGRQLRESLGRSCPTSSK
ncbi:MAG: 6-bladed beta-propeller [Gemmatimonadetes bacterium]|nr:6-bladed beta-propeller [Gemmatimonadota bacterium]MYB99588.1 6-bladed beta-propeller [Gemmatimonadota bacterium]MYI46357.1 6-bladed beta-propeller [Gemmatimonadota bacterium]